LSVSSARISRLGRGVEAERSYRLSGGSQWSEKGRKRERERSWIGFAEPGGLSVQAGGSPKMGAKKEAASPL